MAYSMTFLARGVWGSLPMVTMSGPLLTSFSTSRRTLRRSTSRFFSTFAPTPEPSFTSPSRMCSVPMYSWLKRWASWLANCITLRARSVMRSYMTRTSAGLMQAHEPLLTSESQGGSAPHLELLNAVIEGVHDVQVSPTVEGQAVRGG